MRTEADTGTESNQGDHAEEADGRVLGLFLHRAGRESAGRGESAVQAREGVARADQRSFALEDNMTLGRGEAATVLLSGTQCSRLHARLAKQGQLWVLRDLGSKNGTFVNGVRVHDVALSEQDVVRFGEWVGTVVRAPKRSFLGSSLVGSISDSLFGGPALRAAFQPLLQVARTELRVCLVGETGTGKEVFAGELHRLSERRGRLVAMNCAAVPEGIAEGELFGYRKGAFTGAERAHLGHFRAAHEGTLFLDEILDLPLGLQAKLLRALEERCVVPLGQSTVEPADARVVCASQSPLREAVEHGAFRSDLYGRLAGIEVRIPPLRARREEVWPLLGLLIARRQSKALSVGVAALEQLLLYDWPLNVREVVQLAERLSSLHGELESLTLEHLPEAVARFRRTKALESPSVATGSAGRSEASGDPLPGPRSARDELAAQLLEVLKETCGNVSAAAERLGISRPQAYRLLQRLPGVKPEDVRVAATLDRARDVTSR